MAIDTLTMPFDENVPTQNPFCRLQTVDLFYRFYGRSYEIKW